jgi:hypothetical protein
MTFGMNSLIYYNVRVPWIPEFYGKGSEILVWKADKSN